MLINLAPVIDRPGESVSFSHTLDLSELDFSGRHIANSPITAEGVIENRAGVLFLRARMATTLGCACDRCAREFTLPWEQSVEVLLIKEETDDAPDNAFALNGDMCDLDEILVTAFVLEMPSRFLCMEDCAGLCHRCGADLNDGPCNCGVETDPRLAVLSQLLE